MRDLLSKGMHLIRQGLLARTYAIGTCRSVTIIPRKSRGK